MDRALSSYPRVQELVQGLADEVARATGMPMAPVPQLGPAIVLDQLRVMVFDYRRAGLDLGLWRID